MPSRRAALRDSSLPPDVKEVIELASGPPERLAEAARLTGDSPEQILEAARFYVREILLFEGADAYRVLGVASDAAPAEIKANFRALQHWLHPDRAQSDWEVGYAARINKAWGELRSPERRAAFDARRSTLPTEFRSELSPPRVVADWRDTAPPAMRRQNWLGLGGVLVAVLALTVVALRESLAPPPEWPTRVPASDGSLLPGDRSAGAAASSAPPRQERNTAAGVKRVDPPAPMARPAAPPSPVATTTPPLPQRRLPQVALVPTAEPRATTPVKPDASRVVAVKPPVATAVVAIPQVTAPPPARVVRPSAIASAMKPEAVIRKPPAASVAPVPSVVSAVRAPVAVVATPTVETREPSQINRDVASTPGKSGPAPVATSGPALEVAVANPVQTPPTPPADAPALNGPKQSATEGTSEGALVERVGLVRLRGSELTGYLTGRSKRVPPIWQSMAAQDAAANIRLRLSGDQSGSKSGRGSAKLGDPVWQVSADRATMTSTIASWKNASAPGTLRVELAWKEGMWLVDTIEANNL